MNAAMFWCVFKKKVQFILCWYLQNFQKSHCQVAVAVLLRREDNYGNARSRFDQDSILGCLVGKSMKDSKAETAEQPRVRRQTDMCRIAHIILWSGAMEKQNSLHRRTGFSEGWWGSGVLLSIHGRAEMEASVKIGWDKKRIFWKRLASLSCDSLMRGFLWLLLLFPDLSPTSF